MLRMATTRGLSGAPRACNACRELFAVERLRDLGGRIARRQPRQLDRHLVQGTRERERRAVVVADGKAGVPPDEQAAAADLHRNGRLRPSRPSATAAPSIVSLSSHPCPPDRASTPRRWRPAGTGSGAATRSTVPNRLNAATRRPRRT